MLFSEAPPSQDEDPTDSFERARRIKLDHLADKTNLHDNRPTLCERARCHNPSCDDAKLIHELCVYLKPGTAP